MEMGSISRMRLSVGDRDTTTWRVSIMDAAIHEGTVIVAEDCAYRGLSWQQYASEKRRQQKQKPTGNTDSKPLVC